MDVDYFEAFQFPWSKIIYNKIYHDKIYYFINFFFISSAFIALSGAAMAGQKRLSSDTYKNLNKIFILIYLFKFIIEIIYFEKIENIFTILKYLLPIISCTRGLYLGNIYNANEPKLISAFKE
jgi:hypothetical protein